MVGYFNLVQYNNKSKLHSKGAFFVGDPQDKNKIKRINQFSWWNLRKMNSITNLKFGNLFSSIYKFYVVPQAIPFNSKNVVNRVNLPKF